MARDLVLEVIEQVRGNALGEAAKDLDKVAGATEGADKAARDYSAELKSLDTQISATRLKIRDLGAEFATTNEKATGKELGGERSLLRQLERIRKELEDAAPDLAPAAAALGSGLGARAGGGFVSSFGDAVGALPSQLRGILILSAVAAAVAAAPAVGAVLAGAVTGAVGVGGIAGGIAAASRDPGVRAAASEFGKSISDEFFAGGQAFVNPTIESLGILEQAFKDMDLGDSWERVAPFVTRVAEGIAGMGTRFMPGFNRALEASGPALELLAQELPEIGDALGDMLADFAESEGTLEGWHLLLGTVTAVIRSTGVVVKFAGDEFHRSLVIMREFSDAAIAISGALEDIPGNEVWRRINNGLEEVRGTSHQAQRGMEGMDNATRKTTFGFFEQGDAAHALADAVRRLHEEYSDYLGIQMGVDQANQRVSESLLRLKETLKENGKDWRTNTEAGLENRAMLSASVSALIAQREKNIEAGMSAQEATTRFQAELDALKKLAIAAGISKEALQDLVGDYFVRVNVTTTGDAAYRAAIARAIQGNDRTSGFQHGGDPPIGEPFWVGEAGKELMRLTPTPRVYSHQQSQAMTANSGATARQTAEALASIVLMLQELKQRQPAVVNVYAPEGMSPKELSAVVAREMAWTS